MSDKTPKYVFSLPLGKFINVHEYVEIFKKAFSMIPSINHSEAKHMFDNMDKREELPEIKKDGE